MEAPKKSDWGVADIGSHHTAIPHELGWLAASLDGLGATVLRAQERIAELADRQIGMMARLEALATREDVQRCLAEHQNKCKNQTDPKKLAQSLGIVLAAIAAAAAAILAAVQ